MRETQLREWGWLLELIRKHAEAGVYSVERSDDSINHALTSLGFPAQRVLEGVAAVMGLALEELVMPSEETVLKSDRVAMEMLLPFLAKHPEHRSFREIGGRWLLLDNTGFQASRERLLGWLMRADAVSESLGGLMPRCGLAWVGVAGLEELARSSENSLIRDCAGQWLSRVSA